MKKFSLLLLAFIMTISAAACGPKYIKNTKIKDTEDNRMIVDLLETYRMALEERDSEKLLSLCAPYYYEDMATKDKNDDFTLKELQEEKLPKVFEHADEIYVSMIIDALETEKEKGHVDFRYDYRIHLTFPAGGKWLNDTAFNRFDLVKIDGKWLVMSGL